MGKLFDNLNVQHIDFIEQQHIFFVATAAKSGTVNLSPKSGDTLRIIDNKTIAWLNLTDSGNETAAHMLKKNRMTMMFCAFEGAPLILRVYGQAQALHQEDPLWESYITLFAPNHAARQIYILHIERVQTSCGMAVPRFDYQGDRDALTKWADKQDRADIEAYWLKKNQQSIDGFDTEIALRSGLGYRQAEKK